MTTMTELEAESVVQRPAAADAKPTRLHLLQRFFIERGEAGVVDPLTLSGLGSAAVGAIVGTQAARLGGVDPLVMTTGLGAAVGAVAGAVRSLFRDASTQRKVARVGWDPSLSESFLARNVRGPRGAVAAALTGAAVGAAYGAGIGVGMHTYDAAPVATAALGGAAALGLPALAYQFRYYEDDISAALVVGAFALVGAGMGAIPAAAAEENKPAPPAVAVVDVASTESGTGSLLAIGAGDSRITFPLPASVDQVAHVDFAVSPLTQRSDAVDPNSQCVDVRVIGTTDGGAPVVADAGSYIGASAEHPAPTGPKLPAGNACAGEPTSTLRAELRADLGR